ncbi:serine hydrolase [Flexivirga meconopsidis]|uniref:serine hydrolase n=1 Tax=Flexivirga meconopsidis TaxID=2977121 RepID=UPI0022404941|nr:serine hydrolase [Flexivirga meconopsidis]
MESRPVTRRLALLGGTGAVATGAFFAAPQSASAAITGAQLHARLGAYDASRSGPVAVSVHDRRTRVSWSYNGTWHNETLSIVKVLILATVLRRCQERQVSLTSTQRSQAVAMITRSDNSATNALLTWVGVASVRRVAGLYGLTSTVIQGGTTAGAASWWGYSTTTAADQASLMVKIVWGSSSVLTTANREYIKSLMRQVISSQRWGVCAPPLPTSNQWTTKNGWGPLSGGYRLNSIGYIYGNGRDYAAAILTRSPAGYSYGLTTINGVSKVLYDALAQPLV